MSNDTELTVLLVILLSCIGLISYVIYDEHFKKD